MRRDQTASRLARSGDKPPVVGITLMTRSPPRTAETLASTATASTSTTKESAPKQQQQHQHQHQQHQQQHQRVHRVFEREHSEPSDGRVRRHAQQRQGGVRSNTGSTSGGKLFDPRKDDPVRFAALRKGLGINSSSNDAGGSTSITATHSDGRSLTSSAAPSTATLSNTSSDGRERRRRRAPGSRSTTDSGGADGSKRKGQSAAGEGSAAEGNSYVTELKRRYREMTTNEKELQEEHRLASEHLRKYQAEAASAPASGSSGGAPVVQTIGGLLARSVSMSRASDADRHGFHADGTLQHSYWLDLIAQHRKLAEAHVAFMEAALRPGLPTSLQSLPQSYKIPTRLWHTAFHSLLERFRQALPDWQACKALRDQGLSPVDRQQIHEILDLLTEYIYYAYAYYSNLLENELFKLFRSSWIENLGDIARYRMVVAKIMALLNIKDGVHHGAQRRNSDPRSARPSAVSRPKHAVEVSTERDDNDEDEAAEEALDHASAKMGKDQASIGADVAMDWDLEEREIWRSTARGWYAKGLAEMPGTGRLHHHIGILSRDDDLRALYHFSKSLVTSHAYLAARESILPLFERSSQMRRVEADATLLDLFVHMHGILFTRIQLDDFTVVYDRFAKRLRHCLAGDGRDGITSPSTWMMMAAINIAALQAYGAEMQSDKAEDEDCKSSPLKPAKMEAEQNKRSQRVRLDDEEDEVDADEVVDENAATADPGTTHEARTAVVRDVVDESDALKVPCHTAKALQLAFGMLEILLSHYLDDLRHAANPYVTLILTYFSQECKQAGVLYKMERYVPWEKLVLLGNAIPSSVEPIDPRNDTSLKIRGDAVPLPEDWCLRGMAWVGRRVYERGFWRPHKVERLGLRGSLSLFESEMDMLDRCTRCPYETSEATKENRHEHESEKGRRDDDDDDDDDDDGDDDDDLDTGRERGHDRPKLTLGLLRWKRIVHALTILIKIVPGLDFDIVDRGGSVHARHGRLVVAPPLQQKLVAWRADEARLEVEQAIGHLKLAALEGRSSPSPESASTVKAELNAENLPEAYDEGEEDDEEDEQGRMGSLMRNGDDEEGEQSEEVRELMRRRSELRKQLRDSKVVDIVRNSGSAIAADSKALGQQQSKKPSLKGRMDGDTTSRASGVHLVPGYTTLVLDTNVMLTPTNVVRRLVESSNWLIVVPLSVVTELDGLKRRTGDAVAQRAQEAINYLESTIKTTRRVKVQTSRGNYLTDLRFRTEDIDFTSSSGGGGTDAHDGNAPAASSSSPAAGESSARSVDDVILRCLSWQTGSHFRNRLMLFCPDDDAERQRREAQVAQAAARGDAVARAVLVTLDRNLRVKTRFRQLAAIGPSDLVDLLLNADNTKQGAQPP